MRVAIIGNSGSGKSTLARWLAEARGAPLLDLDTVAWVPGEVAVPRDPVQAEQDVARFCATHPSWVVEGCYSDLITAALAFRPRLLFLNPGEEQCIRNCQSRPWEPHKYASRAEQDLRLPFLLAWVSEYYTRSGNMSLVGHESCYSTYSGPKEELRNMPTLDPPSPAAMSWVQC